MDWIANLLIPLLKSFIVVVGLLVAFAYMTWAERKLVARFQLRYGPNRAGPFGLLQPVADAFKAIFKEELIFGQVHSKVIYVIAPGISLVAALLAFAVVPVGPTISSFQVFGFQVPDISLSIAADVNIGVLYLFAIAGLGTYGIVLGGWTSNNKYSLLGALRTTAQVISYEIPMGLAIVSVLLLTESLSLVKIVEAQAAVPFIVLQPVAALIYLICGLAEANRSPFDLPETENELVSGFATEYGGIKFAIFFMAEYINMIVVCAVFATLFLGGWQWPAAFLTDLHPILAALHPIIAVGLFFAKTAFMLFLFVWIRASLPRVRYDKLMKFCWKFLFPLALANLAVTAVVVALLPI